MIGVLALQVVIGAMIFFVTNDKEVRLLSMSFLLTMPITIGLVQRTIAQTTSDEQRLRELSRSLSNKNWELARSNEQLRIASEHKSEFMSIASHQLRTPLTALTGYLSMILEQAYGHVPIELNMPITRAHQSSLRLTNLVNELLRITRIEQNDLVYDITPVDTVNLLHDLVEEFTDRANKRNLKLTLEIAPREVPYTALADEQKLREVLHNIIDNALNYTPEGSVTVRIAPGAQNTIIIAVADTGIGIAHEDIRMLFAKFQRGERGAKQFADGSGLGLYIAKKLINGMHGKIWIDSEGPGKGAVFSIELPAEGSPVAILPESTKNKDPVVEEASNIAQ
jgi:signal transduction histidine kinase